MMYVPLPIERIELGKPLPINVWDARGNLLLRKGQVIESEHHREQLAAHQASASAPDHKAWVRAYDRLVYAMLRSDASLEQISRATMPATILDIDYAVGYDITGGWLDMQAVLHGLLYQGPQAKGPLERLVSLHKRADELINADADDCLFALFQLLVDPMLGYCATHALMAAVFSELTARKLGVPEIVRPVLFQAALAMNIGMAREQDTLTRQNAVPDARQRELINRHASLGADMLRGFGAVNEDLLDIVTWHHQPEAEAGLPRNLECRRILHAADVFVAKMAARANRVGVSPIGVAKANMIQAVGEEARINGAMTTALGFYPPGTYVLLANGERAVSVRRGAAANTPLVVSVVGAQGLALPGYLARDTREKEFAVQSPIRHDTIKLKLSTERIARAIQRLNIGEPRPAGQDSAAHRSPGT